MPQLRKYGTGTTILFPLIDRGAIDFEDTPVTFAANDTKIMKNEGAAANTTNNPAHEGRGIYSLALTDAEMQAARIVITVIDQSGTKLWEDQAILLETYGHASAQHALDLDQSPLDVNVITLATAALEAIAEKVLSHPISNVEPGAVFRTLYGAVASLVNRTQITSGKHLKVYKTDDSTELATLAGTTDPAQQPINELNP